MPDYVSYFLAAPSSVVELETLEISHPAMTKVYRIVRNARDGITATLETEVEVDFEFYPLRIRPTGSTDDLDQAIQVDLGDLGEIIPEELDAIAEAGLMGVKPTVLYRTYRSDDLSAPMLGPLTLEVTSIVSNADGSAFEARAPALNVNRTGELYRLARFETLRGFM